MSSSLPLPNPTKTSLDRSLGRYEFIQGSSAKFWECLHLEGEGYKSTLLLRWGRIGAKKPQKMTIPFFEGQHRIQKKLREGYVFVKRPRELDFKTWCELERHELTTALEQEVLNTKSELPSSSRRKM